MLNGKRMTETITDFGAQDHGPTVSNSCPRFRTEEDVQCISDFHKLASQDDHTIHTSNKFSALEDDMETGNENSVINNSGIDEVPCDDKVHKVPLSKGDVDHTLKGIRMWAEKEKRNIIQQAEDSGQIKEKGVGESPTPKTPKRWSDIQEEEEENEAQEASPKPFFPKPTDILSFERNGELTEIFMKNGRIRFTPISDKSKN